MALKDGEGRDPARAPENGRTPGAGSDGLLEQAGAEVAGIVREFRVLTRVNADRARQRWRARLDRAWTGLWVGAGTTTAVVAGVLLLGLGLVRLLGAWLGRWPGAGELLAGLVLLVGAGIAGWMRRRWRDQAEVQRLKQAYERLGAPPQEGRTAQEEPEGAHDHEDRSPARAH